MDDQAFARRSRWDGWFWTGFIVCAVVAICFGFAEPVIIRFSGQADYRAPFHLVVHVWSYAAWFLLLGLQAWLAAQRKLDVHRKLGLALLLLVPVMMWSGIASEVHAQRYYAADYPDDIRFLPIPVMNVLTFTGLAIAALVMRKRAAVHKRLILLATTALLTAAFLRWWGEGIGAVVGEAFAGTFLSNYFAVWLLVGMVIVYDRATRSAVHPVYWFAGAFMLAMQMVAVGLYQLDAALPVWRGLIGVA